MMLLLMLIALVPNANAAVQSGRVASSSGQVVLARPGLERRALIVNEEVRAGDIVTTGANGSAKLLFADDSIMDLGPSSSFRVDQFAMKDAEERTALFTVMYGRLRALITRSVSAKGRVEVRTPDTVMGVRGTEFVVNSPLGSRTAVGSAATTTTRTEVTVMSGSVGVAIPRLGGSVVSVPAGSAIVATAGLSAMPSPMPLSAAQLTSVAQSAHVADNTFDRTVTVDSGVQNEAAPASATSKVVAADAVGATAQAAAAGGDVGAVDAIGAFGLLDSYNDVPAELLNGLFQTVTVRLVH